MANQTLFSNKTTVRTPRADTTNRAGGKAYSRSDEAALAQFAATGMFGNTYYARAEEQLDEVLEIAQRVDPTFLAKVAIYSRRSAYLKDMPALLLAVLLTRDTDLFKKAFPQVIDNGRMVRNFVQILRSGVVGRTSLGSAAKKAVQRWFDGQSDDYLFKASVGNNPSLGDVIRLVHPRPGTKVRDNLFAYIAGFPEKKNASRKQIDAGHYWMRSKLPRLVAEFERFKRADPESRKMPNLPFQLLDSAGLSEAEWKQVARDGKWQFTRMNLRTFERHGVFEDRKLTKVIADRLADETLARKARQYPYQVLTTWKMVEHEDGIPAIVKKALHDAVEHTCGNIPEFDGRTAVLVDISSSMGVPINGRSFSNAGRGQVSCAEVASLFAAAIARKNPDAVVYQFSTEAKRVRFNAFDSIFTNAKKIMTGRMGGTSISSGLIALMKDFKSKDLPDNIIVISDNESWADAYGRGGYSISYFGASGGATAMQAAFADYKRKNKNARLVLMDLTPTSNTQAKDNRDILNVGGFSDKVFDVISSFTKSRGTSDFWAKKISSDVTLS